MPPATKLIGYPNLCSHALDVSTFLNIREQYLQIAVKVCPKLSDETALIIADEIWKQQGDIRDVISLSKLVKKHDGPEEIAEIIKTLAKYGYATG